MAPLNTTSGYYQSIYYRDITILYIPQVSTTDVYNTGGSLGVYVLPLPVSITRVYGIY